MILLLFIFLPFIFIYLVRKKAKSTLPPGPPSLPVIGNLHQLATAGDLHFYFHKLSKKYGPIIHLKLGSIRLIVVSSEKLAKEVLKTQDLAFCSRPKSFAMEKLSYNSDILFSPYNDYLREMRKLTSLHLLSPKKTQSFRPIREDEVCVMMGKISKFADSNEVVNMNEMATVLSCSLICRVAFGKKYEEHGAEMKRFEGLLKGFLALTLGFFVTDYFPAFGWVDTLIGSTGKVDRAFQNLDSFYQELIDQHLDPRRAKTEGADDDDILDVLLKLKDSSSFDLTWDHIKGLLMNIFVAGAETSSSVTTWTMTALIKAPIIMKKVQAEIRNAIGEKGKVEEDDLRNLPYLKAVINESFRLYPPAPLLVPRETIEKCTLHGYEIQPQTLVYVNAWAVGRDPEYWESPDEFVPERFLNTNIEVKGQDFGLIPFGSGRRICPGMNMGLANVELTVANLLYSFDWELPAGIRPEDVDTAPSRGLAVDKKIPLLLVPKKYGV